MKSENLRLRNYSQNQVFESRLNSEFKEFKLRLKNLIRGSVQLIPPSL